MPNGPTHLVGAEGGGGKLVGGCESRVASGSRDGPDGSGGSSSTRASSPYFATSLATAVSRRACAHGAAVTGRVAGKGCERALSEE